MEKVAPLSFWIKILLLLVVTISINAGCATSARDLPQDYSSVDARKRLSLDDFDPKTVTMTCQETEDELEDLNNVIASQEQDISSKRHGNQVAGYIGAVFFLPALLATDNSVEAKKKIDDINRALDKLYMLQAYKKCPSQPEKVTQILAKESA